MYLEESIDVDVDTIKTGYNSKLTISICDNPIIAKHPWIISLRGWHYIGSLLGNVPNFNFHYIYHIIIYKLVY